MSMKENFRKIHLAAIRGHEQNRAGAFHIFEESYHSRQNKLDHMKSVIFPLLWEMECYNGITQAHVDACRVGGRLDMGGRVEKWEKMAEKIATAVVASMSDLSPTKKE